MKLQIAFIATIFSLCSPYAFSQNLISQSEVNRVFSLGQKLNRHQQLGGARKQFEDFLKVAPATDPRIPAGEHYVALFALKLYHPDALKESENFIEKNPEDPRLFTVRYEMADFFYRKENYKKAIKQLEKIDFSILSEEQYIAGRFHWGYSLLNLKRLGEALEQFNFIKFLESQFGPAASYYAGFIELNSGDYNNALMDLKRAEKNESYAGLVPYMIASSYYKQSKYDTLLNYISTLEGRTLTNEEGVALLLAEAYFEQGNYKNAFEGYQRYLDSSHREISAEKNILLKAGFSAYATGQDEKALQYLKKSAIDSDSIGFYSSYYLGSLYLKQGLKPLALTAFDYAKKYMDNPTMVEESSYQKAKILYDIERYDEAADELNKFVNTYPKSRHTDEIKKLLSQAYLNVSDYDRAIKYIEAMPSRTLALNAVYQKATWLKGVELFNKEDYVQAIIFFEKSLQYATDKEEVAETSFWNGEAYSIQGKYKQAIRHYMRITNLTGYTNTSLIVRTRYALGYAFFNLKRYERALYNFKEFVKQGQENKYYADGVLRLADCFYVTKSYPAALSNYQKYIQLSGMDKDYALLQTGVVLGIQQQYQQAKTRLEQLIKEYPQSRFIDEAMFQKAQFDFEQGNYVTAISGFTMLIESHSSSQFLPYAYMRRAASYYNLKKYTNTIADYTTVLTKYASHPISKNALLPLQEALSLEGRGKEFDAYLAKYKATNPNAEGVESIEFESAEQLYFNQNYKRAIENFDNYIRAYPASSKLTEATYYQAESYYRLKDTLRSLEMHKKVIGDPSFLRINKSISRIAELEYSLKNYQKAISNFRKLVSMASTKKEEIKAWLGVADSYFMLNKYDSSSFYANKILDQGETSMGSQSKASLLLGKIAMAQENYETAKDEFINTINIAHDEYGAEAKYLLGKVFFLTQDHKQCYEILIDLTTDFAPYTWWVGEAFLLLSDNFIATGDIFQAKGTLRSLIEEFPINGIKLRAKKKLRDIENGEDVQKERILKEDSSSYKNDDDQK